MPPTFMKAFSRSFAKFPDYSFIWQGEQHGSNVLHFDSIDQPSLLAHPKTKLFISHCGQNGLNEAAYFGVPVLAIPFFGDQLYNAAIVQNKRLGICLDKMNINEEVITVALRALLEEDT
ncbi:UDP-glucuronosyl/UDP-glucosyltransferase [Aphelenchoides avenae]|nr:UDP-glucuronosyl/UDP-glucosyltransferase [Aphelenchus avenae]